jgi:hypothetical protein
MKTNSSKKSFKGIEDAGLVIIVCFLVAIGIYHFVGQRKNLRDLLFRHKF